MKHSLAIGAKGMKLYGLLTAGDELMDMRDEWLHDLRSWASKNESVRELWLYGSRALPSCTKEKRNGPRRFQKVRLKYTLVDACHLRDKVDLYVGLT